MCKLNLYLFFLVISFDLFALNETLITKEQFENVFIQTDRDIYIAGEHVFYIVKIFSDDTAQTNSNVCYFVLRDGNRNYNKLYINTNNGNAFGYFCLPDTLQTGYYEIVGFTNYMRNFGETFYYRKQIIVVNRFDENLNNLFRSDCIKDSTICNNQLNDNLTKISLNKDSFKVREKIELKIELDNDLKNKLYIVSISVKEVNPYSQYLGNNDFNCPAKPTNFSPSSFKYQKENEGIYLDGLILNRDSMPITNECLFLSSPDTVANLQYTYSNEIGEFQFFMTDYYLGKQLIINTKDQRSDVFIIILKDKFHLNQRFNPIYFGITSEIKKYIHESQKIVTIQKKYFLNNTSTLPLLKNNNKKVPYVYTEPSSIIYPSAFVSLNNLKEISENIIPDFKIRTERGINYPILVNLLTKQFFQSQAKIFLNGVAIYDLNPLMSWSSDDISKIELCKTHRIKGNIAFSGIISIVSSKKIEPVSINSTSISYNMGEYNGLAYYNPPKYSNNTFLDPIPDFRQLLYWNPSVVLNSKGTIVEFFASDWPSEYIVEVTRTNKNGESLHTFSKLVIYD